MIELSFENYTNTEVDKQALHLILRKIMCFKKIKKLFDESREGIIALTLIGDKEIQKVNKERRGKNMPTDVLSFSYLCAPEEQRAPIDLIGEIIISADTAKKQAQEHKISTEGELQKLFVHGLLHIFGYTHENDKDEREMEDVARRILG